MDGRPPVFASNYSHFAFPQKWKQPANEHFQSSSQGPKKLARTGVSIALTIKPELDYSTSSRRVHRRVGDPVGSILRFRATWNRVVPCGKQVFTEAPSCKPLKAGGSHLQLPVRPYLDRRRETKDQARSPAVHLGQIGRPNQP